MAHDLHHSVSVPPTPDCVTYGCVLDSPFTRPSCDVLRGARELYQALQDRRPYDEYSLV